MNQNERISLLSKMLRQIAEDGDVESLLREPAFGLESMSRNQDEEQEIVKRAIQMIGSNEIPNEREVDALEAIVLPRERPVFFIQNGTYGPLPAPWSHFENEAIYERLPARSRWKRQRGAGRKSAGYSCGLCYPSC